MVKPYHKPGVGCGQGSKPGTFSTKVGKKLWCARGKARNMKLLLMSWTTELAANLLAKKSPAGARKPVAFPTSKLLPGCPQRIIPSMNSRFNSRVREIFFIFFVLHLSFWMLSSLGLKWEKTVLKDFYGNCFCDRARNKPFRTAVAEGNDHLSAAEWDLLYYLSHGYFLGDFVLWDVCLGLLLGKVVTSEHGLIFLSKFPPIICLV